MLQESLCVCFTVSLSYRGYHLHLQALSSLRKYPLPLRSGREARILQYFGDRICHQLDERLEQHHRMQDRTALTGKGRTPCGLWMLMDVACMCRYTLGVRIYICRTVLPPCFHDRIWYTLIESLFCGLQAQKYQLLGGDKMAATPLEAKVYLTAISQFYSQLHALLHQTKHKDSA